MKRNKTKKRKVELSTLGRHETQDSDGYKLRVRGTITRITFYKGAAGRGSQVIS